MTSFSHVIAAVLEVKNSCGYLVSLLVAEAMTLSTVLDPRTAMATTPVLCANWYRAAALNTTSVISESIGIGVPPVMRSTASMASLASSASTKQPGRQTLSSIPASTLRAFFPSAASIRPGIIWLILGLNCGDDLRHTHGVARSPGPASIPAAAAEPPRIAIRCTELSQPSRNENKPRGNRLRRSPLGRQGNPGNSLEALQSANAPDARSVVQELDEADGLDGAGVPGGEFIAEELTVQVIPQATDEFTCQSCFLVRHRSQIARQTGAEVYCTDCEG